MEEGLSQRFCSLEDDYTAYKRAINTSINDLSRGTSLTDSEEVGQTTQTNIVEAQRIIKMMNAEARGKDSTTRKNMLQKIRVYREELQAMQKDFERAVLFSRGNKMSGPSKDELAVNQRERIRQSTEKLQGSSATLDQSRRIIAETEEIGITVLDNLSQQRETLLSSRDKVKETNDYTAQARKIMKRMSRRVLTNKLVLYGVICFLGLCICAVIYYDFIKPSH